MKRIFLITLFLSIMGSAINAMDVSEFALPQGPIRDRLADVFSQHLDAAALTIAVEWQSLNSFHWQVGTLQAADGTTFIVKAQKYPAGHAIPNPNPLLPPMIHAETQNLSRLIMSKKADTIINQKNLSSLRTVQSWAYPLSGDDNDLRNATDATVIVVEEMVKLSANDPKITVQVDQVSTDIQRSILNITEAEFDQLTVLAVEGQIFDLHSGNILRDENGAIVLIDTENLFLHKEKEVEESSFFLRWLKRYKLNQIKNGSVKFGVSQTGMFQALGAQQDSSVNSNFHIEQKSDQLQVQMLHDVLIKRFYFEMGGAAAAINIMLVPAFRHAYYAIKTNHQIQKICKLQQDAVAQLSGDISDEEYLAMARKNVAHVLPKEDREPFIIAAATYAKAQHKIKNHETENSFFWNSYLNPYDAKRRSSDTMKAMLTSDWSLRSKAGRVLKKGWQKVTDLIKNKKTVHA